MFGKLEDLIPLEFMILLEDGKIFLERIYI
jgi:hypothetical protein